MRVEQRVGIAAIGILSATCLLHEAAALGFDPGGSGPACLKKIVRNTYMESSENGCATYTDCDMSYSCQTGTNYNNCGPVQNVDKWCGDYENGVWDSELGRCVGGHMPGSYYHAGSVPGYRSPVFCDP